MPETSTPPGTSSGYSSTPPGTSSGYSSTPPGTSSGSSSTPPGTSSGSSSTPPGTSSGSSSTPPGTSSGSSSTPPGTSSGSSSTPPGTTTPVTTTLYTTPIPTTRIPRPNMGLGNTPNGAAIGSMIETEISRLQQKETSIEKIKQGQARMSVLNDSYRKRYLDYIKIIMVIVTGLAGIWFFSALEKSGTIPSYLNDIFVIAIISVTLIIAWLIFIDIQRHDLLDYDELALNGPSLYDRSKLPTTDPNAPTPTGTLSGSSSASESCPVVKDSCGAGTTFDVQTQKCISGSWDMVKFLSR